MTLQKKIRRSIGKNLSFYLTGSILTAITVMLLVGAFSVSSSLYQCFDDYYEKTNIEDGFFDTITEIPEKEMDRLQKQYHVILEKQQYLDVNIQDTRLRLFAETKKLDLTTVSEGNELTQADEILITYRYAKANGIAVGDTITLLGRELRVCGLCMKPDYAVMLYDFTESMPNQSGFGIGVMQKETLDGLGQGTILYSVRYLDRSYENAFRREIYEKYGTREYVEREANSRIGLIYQEADDLVAEFTLYAPILMIVVVAVIAMVLARTVRREGKNIGTLMAFGYRKKELIRHYMVYGLLPAFAGDVLGVLGSIPFSRAFCSFYFNDAEYIDYTVKLPYKLMLAAALVPIAVYGLVSYLVLHRVLQADIIPLLKGIGREKASGILRKSRAGLRLVYNIRAVTLNGFRSITMVIGIAIATLCIILGGSFQDAYTDLLEEKVPCAMLGGEYEYGFKELQAQNPYGGDGILDISFGAKQDDSRFNLIGYEEQNQILDLLTVDGRELSYGGYYMSSAAAKRYGISAGDSFRFYNTVTMEETEVVISGIIRNDILDLVLSSKENVADIIERPVEEYNVIISKEPLTIPSELLRKNSSLKDYQEQVKNLSMTAGIVLKLLKVLGMLICLLVVSMMSGMIVEESARNISMLGVLGYRGREVRRFVLTSNHLLVPVGFLIGVPLGYLTAYSMILGAARSSGMLMSLPVKADTILTGFAFLAAAYLAAMLLAGRKCKRVDPVESLKCPL